MSLHLNNKKCFLKIQGHLNKTETNWSVIYYSLLKIKMSATSVPITTLLWQFDMQWYSVNCIHIHLILKISMNAGVMTSNKSKQKALPNILLSLFKKVNISHLKLLFINDFAEKMNCHTYHFFFIYDLHPFRLVRQIAVQLDIGYNGDYCLGLPNVN